MTIMTGKRKNLGWKINKKANSIIIFDEGHNLEDVAEAAMEKELSMKNQKFTKQMKRKDINIC